MSRRYWVDWADPAYPTIRVWAEGNWAEAMSLADAKHDLITTLQARITYAREAIAYTRKLRAIDIEEG